MGLNGHRSAATSPPLGGRYQISSSLGAGGFGQTFLARDLHLPGHPQCVIKQLQPNVSSQQALQTARRLFATEAEVLSQLGEHSQIPRLLAHFEENQEFYLAQELIEGQDLVDELAMGEPWDSTQAIAFLSDILPTLAFVHHNRVIHRDLKPANLIRRQQDGRIVLIDFGAVKQVSTQLGPHMANPGRTVAIGTQGYMPGEQVAGYPRYSSDVFAIGMITIQGITGRYPSQLNLHPQTGDCDWHTLATHLHPALVSLIDNMVRFDFRTRYDQASSALAALKALPAELSQLSGQLPGQLSEPGPAYHPLPKVSSPDTAHTLAVGREVPPLQTVTQTVIQTDVGDKSGDVEKSVEVRSLIRPIGIGLSSLALLLLGRFVWPVFLSDPTVTEVDQASTSVEETIAAPAVAEPRTLEPETAILAVENLYRHVSNQDWASARSLFGDDLASQFDPDFFQQFRQVTVENLEVTRRTPETIELVGQNTYFYPDGTLQREQRTFTLQLVETQPRIVASAFVQITQRRGQ
ncbi:MAG: protein kinase [Phormidesmis sp.]